MILSKKTDSGISKIDKPIEQSCTHAIHNERKSINQVAFKNLNAICEKVSKYRKNQNFDKHS